MATPPICDNRWTRNPLEMIAAATAAALLGDRAAVEHYVCAAQAEVRRLSEVMPVGRPGGSPEQSIRLAGILGDSVAAAARNDRLEEWRAHDHLVERARARQAEIVAELDDLTSLAALQSTLRQLHEKGSATATELEQVLGLAEQAIAATLQQSGSEPDLDVPDLDFISVPHGFIQAPDAIRLIRWAHEKELDSFENLVGELETALQQPWYLPTQVQIPLQGVDGETALRWLLAALSLPQLEHLHAPLQSRISNELQELILGALDAEDAVRQEEIRQQAQRLKHECLLTWLNERWKAADIDETG